MKYPCAQFSALEFIIHALNRHIDVKNMQPSQLHFLAYQQVNEGMLHARLGICDGKICRYHSAPDKSSFEPICTPDPSFKLYPEACNDSHIETAVKKIQKQL